MSVNLHNLLQTPSAPSLTPYLTENPSLALQRSESRLPLHTAITARNADAVEELLPYTPVDQLADEEGWTPLHVAAALGFDEGVKKLLQYYCIPTEDSPRPKNPGYRPPPKRYDKTLLLNLPTGTGQTPLHYAVSKRRGGVVETLLSHKDTHPSPQDTYGSTPLHRACALGYAELVKLLIEKGAQMEKEDKEGNTPVLIAVEEGYPAIVQLLVEQGNAQLKGVKNREGKGVAELAKNEEMVKVLKELADKLELK